MKVNTINYEGKKKRAPRRGKWYQQKRYKKAIVTIDETIRAEGVESRSAASEFIEGEVVMNQKKESEIK